MSFSHGRVVLSVASLGAVLVGFPLSQRAQGQGQCQHHGHHHAGGMVPGGGPSPGLTIMQQQQLQQMLLQQQMLQQRVLQQQDLQLKQLDREIRELSAGGIPVVKTALTSLRAESRWAAARVVGLQDLPLREELIQLLTDSNAHVRQAAREGLIGLSVAALRQECGYQVECKTGGLRAGIQAGPTAQRTAARKWRTWWERLESGQMDAKALTAKGIARPEAAKKAAPPTPEDEAAHLSKELIQAKPPRREVILSKLRDGKGGVYTDALADAIPSLTGDARDEARDALVERLSRMKPITLRDKLQDDNAEVRGAAALACAMKEAKSHIPDLIALLDDPERFVALAAKTALKSMTGQNFGRVVGVARAEKVRAIGDWNEWWQKQNGR